MITATHEMTENKEEEADRQQTINYRNFEFDFRDILYSSAAARCVQNFDTFSLLNTLSASRKCH